MVAMCYLTTEQIRQAKDRYIQTHDPELIRRGVDGLMRWRLALNQAVADAATDHFMEAVVEFRNDRGRCLGVLPPRMTQRQFKKKYGVTCDPRHTWTAFAQWFEAQKQEREIRGESNGKN